MYFRPFISEYFMIYFLKKANTLRASNTSPAYHLLVCGSDIVYPETTSLVEDIYFYKNQKRNTKQDKKNHYLRLADHNSKPFDKWYKINRKSILQKRF